MGRYTGKTCRLLTMLVLTSSFFLVEIIVGYITNSVALIGDAYHMLSDMIALIVGFTSVRISKWHSRKNTFGWARAEVLGALINAVFLLALSFTILVEALQHVLLNEEIQEPNILLIVGCIGLAVNILGLIIFGSHGHSHGGSDSHETISRVVTVDVPNEQEGATKEESTTLKIDHKEGSKMSKSLERNGVAKRPSFSESSSEEEEIIGSSRRKKAVSASQLNMRGVLIHVLGDALGSVIVIISALVIKYTDISWKHRVDPILSMILVAIICCTTIPLLRESAMILLQTVPTHIRVKDLKKRLITRVHGVIGLHEFHIWQLAGNRIIATAHIRCQNLHDYQKIAEEVKRFFHEEGIHSTTIQPEFVEMYSEKELENLCLLNCGESCHRLQCCYNSTESDAKLFALPPSPDTDNWIGDLGHGVSTDSLGSTCDKCTFKPRDPRLVPLQGASPYSPYVNKHRNTQLSVDLDTCDEHGDRTFLLRHRSVDLHDTDALKTESPVISDNMNSSVPRTETKTCASNLEIHNEKRNTICGTSRSQDNLLSDNANLSGESKAFREEDRFASMYFSVGEELPSQSEPPTKVKTLSMDSAIAEEITTETSNLQQMVPSVGDGGNNGCPTTSPPMCSPVETSQTSLVIAPLGDTVVDGSNTNNNDQSNAQQPESVMQANCISSSNRNNPPRPRNPALQSRYLSIGERPPLVRQDAVEIDETNNNM